MNRLSRQLPPLATLLPFEAAARHESFTRAAAELHLTQAAISRQIRALENDLGTPLFTRSHRAVRLTDAGLQLARALSTGLETIAATAHRLRSRRDNDDIILLAEIYVAMYWLIPRLPAFHETHPDIRLRVNASTQPLTHAEESFDIALQCSDRPAGALTPLFSVPDAVFPVCSPAVAAEGSLTLAELMTYPLLHCRDDPQDGWMTWNQWFDAVGSPATATGGLVFDNYPVVLQAAVMGQGVGLGWGRGVEYLLSTGQLVRPTSEQLVLADGLSVYRTVSAAAEQPGDRRLAVVTNWLASALND
ncbi:LysR family transcriptional regulator [Salinisphaera aquimarina]|uniref:LysR family transcriptional regulator n=1 Tax=Salinisphaera aquimarina TaxID=2094031 RepID=A0ABV7EP91_9GAMM